MHYTDFTKEMEHIFKTVEPSLVFTSNIKNDILFAVAELSPAKALAMLTCLKNAFSELRDLAAAQFVNSLPFDHNTGQKYNDGKNFTTPENLVFRISTKADYNYSDNDDLDAGDYGMNIAALCNQQNRYQTQLKLLTKQIALRKELILTEHPRMAPIPGSISHVASYLGNVLEIGRNVQLNEG